MKEIKKIDYINMISLCEIRKEFNLPCKDCIYSDRCQFILDSALLNGWLQNE